MRRIMTLALKDLLLLWRDKFGLFWVAVFPLAFAAFFGSIFSTGDNEPSAIKIAVIDEDSSSHSSDFVAELEESDLLDVVYLDIEEARERIRRGKLTAFVAIEKGFAEQGRLFFGGSLPIRIGVDPSRKAESGYLRGIVTRLMFESLQKRMSDSRRMIADLESATADIEKAEGITASRRDALKGLFGSLQQMYESADSGFLEDGQLGIGDIEIESVEKPVKKGSPRSYYDISFPQATIWGLIGCAAAFAISMVQERTSGTLLRLRLAPVGRVHILAGKGAACFLACVAEMVLLLLFGKFVFGVFTGNIIQISLAVVASALCFVGIMMLISVLGKTERAVAGAGWAVLMVMAMAGGGMVPSMVMPGWMKAIGQFSPVKWAIYSLEGAIWRDFTVSEMMVPAGVLVGIGLVFFTSGAIVFSRGES